MSTELSLEFEQLDDPQAEWVRRASAWEAPRLPGLRRGQPRRWESTPTWQPADTILLSRHREQDGPRTVVTTDRTPPPGYRLEYDLGALSAHQQPGTLRLLWSAAGTWLTTPFDGMTASDHTHLGWLEQASLPMLEPLMLAVDPDTGLPVLVGGDDDPLSGRVASARLIGWLESFPSLPREVEAPLVTPGLVVLRRTVDRDRWHHRYGVAEADGATPEDESTVAIGGLWATERPGFVALRRESDGRVASELLAAPELAAGRDNVRALRWTVAPMTWADRPLPRAWGVRAAIGRGRRAVRGFAPPAGEPTTLGYVRRDSARGWEPLYAATHPVTGDQMLSLSRREVGDVGYRLDGVVGHVASSLADGLDTLRATEIPWGARFGHGRRF